jgi:hypothetical protein
MESLDGGELGVFIVCQSSFQVFNSFLVMVFQLVNSFYQFMIMFTMSAFCHRYGVKSC